MYKTISFERVKRVVLDNLLQPDFTTCIIGAIRAYVGDGLVMTAKDVRNTIMERTRSYVKRADVRCLGWLLELCPKGRDSRLPGWLYGPVEILLGENGWELAPAA